MRKTVQAVLIGYPHPPVGNPHELTQFILDATAFREFLNRESGRGTPVEVRHFALDLSGMGTHRWPVPQIDDPVELAGLLQLPLEHLVWASDVRGLQRRTPPGRLHLYSHRWIKRPNSLPRLIESPTPLSRAVLRRVLNEVLVWVPVQPAAHGSVRGRSAVTNASMHVGAPVVLCLDLRTFFVTITASRIDGIFASMGYSESVAWTLTALCTHQTPAHVLSRMPPGGDPSPPTVPVPAEVPAPAAGRPDVAGPG